MEDLLPIKTERLTIRKITLDDVDLLLKMDKQEETQRFLGGVKNKTREERIEFLKNKKNSLAVCLGDIPIGFAGVKIKDNTGELGYIFDYDYWNNGYCTEACKKLIEIAFDKYKIDKIIADTVKGNERSERVLKRLGFKRIGEHGDFYDYELLNDKKHN